MNAIAASPEIDIPTPPPVVARSTSDTLGVFKLAKGTIYYPAQWLAGVAAVYVLTGFAPTPARLSRVALIRGVGVLSNNTLGDGIKNGVPFDLGIKFDKTPTEQLYSLNLPKYAFQRVSYSASAAMWSGLFAVALTLAMPYAAPVFIGLGQSVTTLGLALGGLASAHSGLAAGAYQAASGASYLLGNAMQLWPVAFAMKEGTSLATMAMNTVQGVFMVNFVAGILTDIIGLEKFNPYHRHKMARLETSTALAR